MTDDHEYHGAREVQDAATGRGHGRDHRPADADDHRPGRRGLRARAVLARLRGGVRPPRDRLARLGRARCRALRRGGGRCGLPSHVELAPGGTGLRETSYAKVEDVKSVSQQRFGRRLGVVGPDHLLRMTEALQFLMGL
ncbi:transcriptional modulator of MazE/toxin, MazF [Frankia casuarinae]|uniref:Transcriptional modulator of MazE/toxin, MazF n=1 Tax=Frankia casuarinae (strain DSM 45818 / CECT 9043 / HFP020203 / CcI3) TaxID=106370 RepID=Q2J6N5_FRACC|nr:transcriptional modulator of MazE/toxin, MazF [Frankia casuarinae]